MEDVTETVRRVHQALVNDNPRSREELESLGTDVWDTAELQEAFTVEGFRAPYAVVTRKLDGVRGSVTFQHNPRLYFDFMPDIQEQL